MTDKHFNNVPAYSTFFKAEKDLIKNGFKMEIVAGKHLLVFTKEGYIAFVNRIKQSRFEIYCYKIK